MTNQGKTRQFYGFFALTLIIGCVLIAKYVNKTWMLVFLFVWLPVYTVLTLVCLFIGVFTTTMARKLGWLPPLTAPASGAAPGAAVDTSAGVVPATGQPQAATGPSSKLHCITLSSHHQFSLLARQIPYAPV